MLLYILKFPSILLSVKNYWLDALLSKKKMKYGRQLHKQLTLMVYITHMIPLMWFTKPTFQIRAMDVKPTTTLNTHIKRVTLVYHINSNFWVMCIINVSDLIVFSYLTFWLTMILGNVKLCLLPWYVTPVVSLNVVLRHKSDSIQSLLAALNDTLTHWYPSLLYKHSVIQSTAERTPVILCFVLCNG